MSVVVTIRSLAYRTVAAFGELWPGYETPALSSRRHRQPFRAARTAKRLDKQQGPSVISQAIQTPRRDRRPSAVPVRERTGPRPRLDPIRANSAVGAEDSPRGPRQTTPSSCVIAASRSRSLRLVTVTERCPPPAWNGSWNGAPDNPSAVGAVSAITCAIGAASALGA